MTERKVEVGWSPKGNIARQVSPSSSASASALFVVPKSIPTYCGITPPRRLVPRGKKRGPFAHRQRSRDLREAQQQLRALQETPDEPDVGEAEGLLVLGGPELREVGGDGAVRHLLHRGEVLFA